MKRGYFGTAMSFWQNIGSLRDYADNLRPLASDHDKNRSEKLVEGLKMALEISDEEFEIISTEMSSGEKQIAVTEKNFEETVNVLPNNLKEKLSVFLRDSMFLAKRSSVDLLHRSALITLVGFFEVLLADLLHLYYQMRPEALSGDDKILSFNDLSKFNSIDEAIEQIIEDKVDVFLRGSLEDWKQFFRKQFKVDMEQLVPNWGEFAEIFQRRHILVHNDGLVNKRYLQKVGKNWLNEQSNPISIGESLSVSGEYLSNAITIFVIAGILLVDLCWQKMVSNEQKQRDFLMHQLTYNCLLNNEWNVARSLCNHVLGQGCSTQTETLIFTINYWLSQKRLGFWEEVKSKVEEFDLNACHPRFSLSIYSLKEDGENFFRILPIAVGSGLTKEELEEWPILDEMRHCDRFGQALKELFPEE